jgi:adenosylmethionine-8-amino-7-oxononanoate aminotransferase
VLTSDKIYNYFYDDYDSGNSFLHSHTYSGNALAASVASEVITILNEESLIARAASLGNDMRVKMYEIAENTGKLKNIRGIGAMMAADLIVEPTRRAGFELYQHAIELGALLRPLGNTIYWLPPLNTDEETLTQLKMITEKAIRRLK